MNSVMASERAVQGTPFTGSDRPSRSFGKGRVCKEPGCETRLSMYNSGKFCYEHEPMAVPRTRGRKIA
ncbi:MAG: hypothetical protein ACLGIO_12385 [Acidimicrobiia bacterium]